MKTIQFKVSPARLTNNGNTEFYFTRLLRSIAILSAATLLSPTSNGQNLAFKTYQYQNSSSGLKFTMNIPQSWKERSENDDSGFFQTFVETDSSGTVIKNRCVETVTYKLKYFSTPIIQAMEKLGFREGRTNMFIYELNDFIHVVVGFEMKENNYTGLDCSFLSSFPCDSKKSKKKDAEMLFLFFSNGAETICLTNNAVPLSESELNEIKKTFTFK